MKNLLNPKWIFIINTLPIALLFFFYFSEFNIIKSLLNTESIDLWKIFGWILGIMGIFNFAYGIILALGKRPVSVFYAILALICYIPYIYLFYSFSDKLVPFSVPRWLISANVYIYIGTFLMPTLIYSLFILIVQLTPENKEHKASKNFFIAILVPILWYVFSQIILPFWQPVDNNFGTHSLLILIISGTIVFLFFLIRGVFIISMDKAQQWQNYQLLWKIPFSIILPLIGLTVNNGHFINKSISDTSGIFGDFNSNWFYILAVINGIFICLPALENKFYRLILFIGRSITFAYTFYFFLVFLPFLPISVVAIVAIGTGFLMLTPLVLFVIHVNELSKDFAYLKSGFSKNLIWIVSVLSFLLIPACITIDYLNDKGVLNETLNYIYNPDYSKSYHIDKKSLKRTLDKVKYHKEKNNDTVFGCQQPYLSTFFNWLVLDNLTLSDSKINSIEKIFWAKASFNLLQPEIQKKEVVLNNIEAKSTYDQTQKVWISYIELELSNKSTDTGFMEYACTFELPEGCWISDYYLYIGKKKERGILAEKKTAMWVFSNIRNENKDPGILYYLSGNKVALRVFPFTLHETRKTEIELLHKEPIILSIDGKSIQLGHVNESDKTGFENANMVYISSQQKISLPKVTRKPYFHFLVNASRKELTSKLIQRIEKAVAQNKSLTENARISYVNSYVNSFPFDSKWKENFKNQDFEGGFYLDRAIRSVLYKSYKSENSTFPVMVVVTDSLKNAVIDRDFADLKFCFPESSLFYNLKDDGTFELHSLSSNPSEPIKDTIRDRFSYPVREYRLKNNTVVYLPDNNQPSVVLKNDLFDIQETQIKAHNWSSALSLQGKWMSQTLHPETSDKEWLNLVRYSFKSKIMTPVTSYLVLENESQKAMLIRKQQQIMSGNKSLDLGEDAQRMSEPGLIITAVLLLSLLGYRQRKLKSILKK